VICVVAQASGIVPNSLQAEAKRFESLSGRLIFLYTGVRTMAHKCACIACVLVSAWLSQPVFAQRGGGGGGGQCGGGSQSAAGMTTPYALNSMANYSQNPLASMYAQRQMEQQYVQQRMAMQRMYAMQMENQMLRNQLMQMQNSHGELAQVKTPVNAQGDSNILLASKKNADNTTAKKKPTSRTRTAASRDKQKDSVVPEADKIAMNNFN
jgi:hypothetical protein